MRYYVLFMYRYYFYNYNDANIRLGVNGRSTIVNGGQRQSLNTFFHLFYVDTSGMGM
jgi:hypothetical protein